MKTTNGMGVGKGGDGTNVNGQNRPTVGDSLYKAIPDQPSKTAFMEGAVRNKEGSARVGDATMGGSSIRQRTTVDRLGAKYGVQITHKPGYVENASTLANGRIVPSVINRSQAFRAQ